MIALVACDCCGLYAREADSHLCPLCGLSLSFAECGGDVATHAAQAGLARARAACVLVEADALDASGIYPSPLVWELDHEPVCTDAGCDCEFSAVERAEADEIADAHRDAAIEHQDAHTIECPTCDGHGDVPSGRYSLHNPTGLVECPRCRGDRYVTCDSRGEGPHVAYDADEIAALRAEAV